MLGVAVAIHTPPHVEIILRGHNVHGVDLAVAFTAIKSKVDVRRVAETRMVRKVMDLNPLNGLPSFPGVLDLLNLGALRQHHSMAVHTGVCARYRRVRTLPRGDVAIPTGDLILPCVELVTKRNRLLGCISLTRINAARESDQD